jgi:predicted  nucleic acid-binding Zn-ribbon protein
MVDAINANKLAEQENQIEIEKASPKADKLQKRIEDLTVKLQALHDHSHETDLELKLQQNDNQRLKKELDEKVMDFDQQRQRLLDKMKIFETE